jgi:hypothetical protein
MSKVGYLLRAILTLALNLLTLNLLLFPAMFSHALLSSSAFNVCSSPSQFLIRKHRSTVIGRN